MSELFTGEAIGAAMSGDTSASTSASDPSSTAAGVLPAEGTPTTQAADADGTATPDPDQAAQADDTTKGPIPFTAHKTALENARTKAAQEVEAKYAFAAQIAEQHRPTVGQFYQLLDSEPTNAVEVLMRTIAADPQHAPKLRSMLGRLLGNRPGASPTPQPAQNAAPTSAEYPEPDFEDGQGNTFYSAKAMKDAFAAMERRVTAQVTKKYEPIETDYRTRAQREAQARADAESQREAATWAEQRYAKVEAWPHFKAHEAAIAAAMHADDSLDVGDAYVQVVVPKLSQQERASVVASMHDKANAAGLNPAHASSAAPKAPKTFRDAFASLPAGAL